LDLVLLFLLKTLWNFLEGKYFSEIGNIQEKNQIMKSSFDNIDNLFKNAVELKELSSFINTNMTVYEETQNKSEKKNFNFEKWY